MALISKSTNVIRKIPDKSTLTVAFKLNTKLANVLFNDKEKINSLGKSAGI